MNDDDLKVMLTLVRSRTALGRLSWRETADAIRFLEANGYTITGQPAQSSAAAALAPDPNNTFTTHQAGGNRADVA